MKMNFKEQIGDTRPYWKVAVSLLFSVASTVLFLVVGYKLLVYFMPFVVGWVISAIAYPVVNWLERRVKLRRRIGTALMIILVLAGVVLLIYLAVNKLLQEVATLSENMPQMYQDFENGLRHIGNGMNGFFKMLPESLREAGSEFMSNLDQTAGNVVSHMSAPTVAAAGNLAKRIPSLLISTIVAFVSAYFFTADRDRVLAWMKQVAPDAIVSRMTMVTDNLKYAIGGYLKAQFKIMVVVFVILLVGFLLMGIHFSFLLALLIALLDFLPFFGTGTALIPWGLYKLLTGSFTTLAGLVVLYAVTQVVRQLIQPKLVGDSIGLSPLLTLIFIYIGYRSGGIFGMIFAVPVGLILINLYKAGAFDYILDDVKILAEGVLSLRN